MTDLTLGYRDIITGGTAVHIARAQVTPARPKALHGHDFFELFWVQNGQIRHHTPGGIKTLPEGSVGFMRPGDTHGLQGRGDHALVVSLTLHPSPIDALGKRHAALQGQFFWADTPQILHLDMQAMLGLNQAALTLERSALDRLSTEAFLLPICAGLSKPAQPDTPKWLRHAMATAKSPKVFRQGAAGLVAATGQTHPHVSRTMKQATGISPSAYINDLRMTHAARQLTSTSDALADIATEIGVPNLSHFHKIFLSHHKMTPHQYRRKFQRDVVQPIKD